MRDSFTSGRSSAWYECPVRIGEAGCSNHPVLTRGEMRAADPVLALGTEPGSSIRQSAPRFTGCSEVASRLAWDQVADVRFVLSRRAGVREAGDSSLLPPGRKASILICMKRSVPCHPDGAQGYRLGCCITPEPSRSFSSAGRASVRKAEGPPFDSGSDHGVVAPASCPFPGTDAIRRQVMWCQGRSLAGLVFSPMNQQPAAFSRM